MYDHSQIPIKKGNTKYIYANDKSIVIFLFDFAVEDVTKMGSDFLDGERPALVRPSCMQCWMAPPPQRFAFLHSPSPPVSHVTVVANIIIGIVHHCGG